MKKTLTSLLIAIAALPAGAAGEGVQPSHTEVPSSVIEERSKRESNIVDIRTLAPPVDDAHNDPPATLVTTSTPFPEDIRILEREQSGNWDVITEESRDAILGNDRNGIVAPSYGRVQDGAVFYDYSPEKRYLVYTTPDRIAAIHLQPGESIPQDPVLAGDASFWFKYLEVGKKDTETYQIIINVGAKVANSSGALVVATNKRLYYFVLIAHPDFATEIVKFDWTGNPGALPSIPPAAATRQAEQRTAGAVRDANYYEDGLLRTVLPSELNFDFEVLNPCKTSEVECTTILTDKIEEIRPTQVFHDFEHTYIQYRRKRRPARSPVLFLRGPRGDLKPIPYIQKDEMFVVRLVFDEAILMLDKSTYIVIKRNV